MYDNSYRMPRMARTSYGLQNIAEIGRAPATVGLSARRAARRDHGARIELTLCVSALSYESDLPPETGKVVRNTSPWGHKRVIIADGSF